jgi:hypothetical protein
MQATWHSEVIPCLVSTIYRLSLILDLHSTSTGSAGIIQTAQRFSHGAIVAGILGIVASVGWAVQGLGNAFYYRQVNSLSCFAPNWPFTAWTDLERSHRCRSYNGKGKLYVKI